MNARRSIHLVHVIAVLVTCLLQTGCFSFSGPSDVRNLLVRETGVRLEKDFGVSIGPLGVAFVQLVGASHLPMSLDGLESVDVGVYRVCEESEGCMLAFDDLEIDGWERIARVREGSSQIVIMVGAEDSERGLRRLLVLAREGSEVHIVRVKGDLEKLVETAFDTFGPLDGLDGLDGLELLGPGNHEEAEEPEDADQPVEPVEVEWVRASDAFDDFDVSIAARN